ncbi:MAG TPA: hypothetical protein VK914_00975, partial [bacterium]|nr:hypothetical protein [bacterium]
MKNRVSHRGLISGALFALGLMLCPNSLFAALDQIPWVLQGNAVNAQTGNVVVVPDQNGLTGPTNQAGAMWDPCAINVNEAFNLSWTVNLGGNEMPCGADGMAFVLQTGGTGVIGLASGEHGYDNGSIPTTSLAVVLDTYTNAGSPYFDPTYESLGIEDNNSAEDAACNGTGPVTIANTFGGCRPPILPGGANASNGQNLTVDFIWTPNTVTGDATYEVLVN